MIELERTFLAEKLPDGLKGCESKEVIDIYIPKLKRHPTVRIRKNGDKCEITKKEPTEEGDVSKQKEHTIPLREEEFNELAKLDGKKVRKIRYLYPWKDMTAEIDVFQDELLGLIVIDFEFKTIEEKDAFIPPDFCGAEITQEEFVAGGMICGKTYEDVKDDLARYKYEKLFLE
jgi:CYTH domain-containing protein